MEDVLSVYLRPYDPKFPVVCMDESGKQLVGEVARPIPMAPGHPVLKDDEYVRNGVAEIFLAVEPLAGFREVKITERRTMEDWAIFIRDMADGRYAAADQKTLAFRLRNMATCPHEFKRNQEQLPTYQPRLAIWRGVFRRVIRPESFSELRVDVETPPTS